MVNEGFPEVAPAAKIAGSILPKDGLRARLPSDDTSLIQLNSLHNFRKFGIGTPAARLAASGTEAGEHRIGT
jgi:hypothetical protein